MSDFALTILSTIVIATVAVIAYHIGFASGVAKAQRPAPATPTVVPLEAIERAYDFHHGVDALPARTRDGARAYHLEHTPAQREAFDGIREKLLP